MIEIKRAVYKINDPAYFKLSQELQSINFIKYAHPAGNYRMPAAGVYEVDARDYDYVMRDGLIIRDWSELRDASYIYMCYLVLPASCMPCPLDPSYTSGASKVAQAVEWLFAAPGRTQSDAARLFNTHQSAISAKVQRMRRKGQI